MDGQPPQDLNHQGPPPQEHPDGYEIQNGQYPNSHKMQMRQYPTAHFEEAPTNQNIQNIYPPFYVSPHDVEPSTFGQYQAMPVPEQPVHALYLPIQYPQPPASSTSSAGYHPCDVCSDQHYLDTLASTEAQVSDVGHAHSASHGMVNANIDPGLLDLPVAPVPVVTSIAPTFELTSANAAESAQSVLATETLAAAPVKQKRQYRRKKPLAGSNADGSPATAPPSAAAPRQGKKRKSAAEGLTPMDADLPVTAAVKKRKSAPKATKDPAALNNDAEDGDPATDDEAASIAPSMFRERKFRKNGRVISARPARWIDGKLVIIEDLVAPTNPDANASAPTVASSPGSDGIPISLTVPETAVPDSAAAFDTDTAPEYDGLVHRADPGVDVSGPPQLSGPDDPDADVEVAPSGAPYPSVVRCLKLCKLPYGGSVKWEDLEGKDVLRAVRRFRLQFPAVSWTFAEDYICYVFGKKTSEKTRGGKRSENNKAEKIGLPKPHAFRAQKNSKASKAKAAAAAAAATAEGSESPTDFTPGANSAPIRNDTCATLNPDLPIAVPTTDVQVDHHLEAPALALANGSYATADDYEATFLEKHIGPF
ncbi:hypothetical protein FPQ18DRAFT_414071 [Pyronema domesticum]|nr:hypothetical protein FPQ18DRAFT_414071 [Pyronema domesticum]